MSMHWWQTINDCVGRWRPAVAFSNECDATAVLFLSSQWNEDPQIVPRVATGGASTATPVNKCVLIWMKWTDHKADGMEFCVFVADRVDNSHWYLVCKSKTQSIVNWFALSDMEVCYYIRYIWNYMETVNIITLCQYFDGYHCSSYSDV